MFFMYLVAFQNIFRKIFSGVWKRSWKRRRKRQNPEKPGQTQKNTARSRDGRSDLGSRLARTVLREIVIDGAISQSVDRNRRERCFARSRRRIAIVSAISRSTVRVDHDLANGASREIAPLNPAFFLSLVLPLREPSLRVPSSGNHLK